MEKQTISSKLNLEKIKCKSFLHCISKVSECFETFSSSLNKIVGMGGGKSSKTKKSLKEISELDFYNGVNEFMDYILQVSKQMSKLSEIFSDTVIEGMYKEIKIFKSNSFSTITTLEKGKTRSSSDLSEISELKQYEEIIKSFSANSSHSILRKISSIIDNSRNFSFILENNVLIEIKDLETKTKEKEKIMEKINTDNLESSRVFPESGMNVIRTPQFILEEKIGSQLDYFSLLEEMIKYEGIFHKDMDRISDLSRVFDTLPLQQFIYSLIWGYCKGLENQRALSVEDVSDILLVSKNRIGLLTNQQKKAEDILCSPSCQPVTLMTLKNLANLGEDIYKRLKDDEALRMVKMWICMTYMNYYWMGVALPQFFKMETDESYVNQIKDCLLPVLSAYSYDEKDFQNKLSKVLSFEATTKIHCFSYPLNVFILEKNVMSVLMRNSLEGKIFFEGYEDHLQFFAQFSKSLLNIDKELFYLMILGKAFKERIFSSLVNFKETIFVEIEDISPIVEFLQKYVEDLEFKKNDHIYAIVRERYSHEQFFQIIEIIQNFHQFILQENKYVRVIIKILFIFYFFQYIPLIQSRIIL